jgi:hypothetical protein
VGAGVCNHLLEDGYGRTGTVTFEGWLHATRPRLQLRLAEDALDGCPDLCGSRSLWQANSCAGFNDADGVVGLVASGRDAHEWHARAERGGDRAQTCVGDNR